MSDTLLNLKCWSITWSGGKKLSSGKWQKKIIVTSCFYCWLFGFLLILVFGFSVGGWVRECVRWVRACVRACVRVPLKKQTLKKWRKYQDFKNIDLPTTGYSFCHILWGRHWFLVWRAFARWFALPSEASKSGRSPRAIMDLIGRGWKVFPNELGLSPHKGRGEFMRNCWRRWLTICEDFVLYFLGLGFWFLTLYNLYGWKSYWQKRLGLFALS